LKLQIFCHSPEKGRHLVEEEKECAGPVEAIEVHCLAIFVREKKPKCIRRIVRIGKRFPRRDGVRIEKGNRGEKDIYGELGSLEDWEKDLTN